jgi:hypothetical protein
MWCLMLRLVPERCVTAFRALSNPNLDSSVVVGYFARGEINPGDFIVGLLTFILRHTYPTLIPRSHPTLAQP